MEKIYQAIAHHIKHPATRHAPFVQGLYHGQWITLLTLGALLILFAVLSWAGANPPSLPLDSIIRPPEGQSPMPIPEEWTHEKSLQALSETALGDHFISFENIEGIVHIDMLGQLTPVYPTASGPDGQTQELVVNPIHAKAARTVAAYLIKASFTRFSRDVEAIHIQLSYPYRDGLGGSGLAPGDVMTLTQKDAAALDWHSVTSSTLIKQTLQ